MKPKVLVLTTGGTIGHRSQQDGVAVMDFDPQGLIASIGLPDVDLEFRSIFRKGSMDIVPGDWVVLAEAVAQAVALRPRGVVILHGTDTMHYTASALAFMLRDLGVPVVMTGSMIPGGDSGSDAIPNLRDAIVVAAEADFAEVCIVFSADAKRTKGVIIRGCRARKVHSHAIDAFASINVPAIGTIAGNDDRSIRVGDASAHVKATSTGHGRRPERNPRQTDAGRYARISCPATAGGVRCGARGHRRGPHPDRSATRRFRIWQADGHQHPDGLWR